MKEFIFGEETETEFHFSMDIPQNIGAELEMNITLSLDKTSDLPGESVTTTFSLSSPLSELSTNHFSFYDSSRNSVPDSDNGKLHPITQNTDGSFSGKNVFSLVKTFFSKSPETYGKWLEILAPYR